MKNVINPIIYYRPVALTSVGMNSFEHLVLAYLKSIIDPLLDPLQFAYKANISVDNTANNMTLLVFGHQLCIHHHTSFTVGQEVVCETGNTRLDV